MADSFFSRKWRIERERIEKQREAMKEYDATVYYPAKKQLQEECAKVGHTPDGRWHFNVVGRGFQHCGGCGLMLWEEEDKDAA